MKYSAKIISKNVFNGLLTVEVEFRSEDGKDIFNDKFCSSSVQDTDWIDQVVLKKLSNLENLDTFLESIEVGKEIKKDLDPVSKNLNQPLSHKEEFQQKLNLFRQCVSGISMGIMTAKNEEFLNLQTWLKNNLNLEYLDLL